MDPEPRCLERVGNVKSQEAHALGDVTAPNGVVSKRACGGSTISGWGHIKVVEIQIPFLCTLLHTG